MSHATAWITIALAILTLSAGTTLSAADTTPRIIHVDNVRGDDATGDGSAERPFAAIPRGIKELRPGSTLAIANTGVAYPGNVRVEVSGTPEAPIVIEGHGAVISGMSRRPATEWQAQGNDVFSTRLQNNAWGMASHWEGGFALVRFNGQDGANMTRREDLVPLSYFLYKNRANMKDDPLHNTLFIRLPAGKTPDDLEVKVVGDEGGYFVGGNHVVTRNLIAEFFGRDGFATHRNKGVVFEGVEGRFNMDQGMSHHGAEVIVRRSHFHHNAGCGVVDVYPEVVVRYEDCLIENDTWRGGVEFHSGRFEMINCVIRGNAQKAMSIHRGARVTLRNCLLVGPDQATTAGISMDDECSLDMAHCTLYNFRDGINARLAASARLNVNHCAFLACQTNWRLTLITPADGTPPVMAEVLKADANAFAPNPFTLTMRTHQDGRWQIKANAFPATEWDAFRQATGTNPAGIMLAEDIRSEAPWSLPQLAGKGPDNTHIGAAFDGPPKIGPANSTTTPK